MTSDAQGRVRRLPRFSRKDFINIAVLVVLCVVLAILAPNFASLDNVTNVLRQIAVIGIIVCAVTMVMIAGGLDLSVGGVVALSGVTAAILSSYGLPLGVAFVIGALVGGLAGLVNGFLIVVVRINSVIATLGTLYVTRGIANVVSNGQPVYDVPPDYGALGTGSFIGIPIPVWIMAGVFVVFWFVHRRTLLGKYAIAVGSNLEAATLSGIHVKRVQIVLYGLSGLMAGLGGIIVSSRLTSGQPTSGQGLEFDVIVAAVLGGTSLLGGIGSIPGALIGALILGVISNGLNLLGVQTFYQLIVQGVILVIAVALDTPLRKRITSPLKRAKPGSS